MTDNKFNIFMDNDFILSLTKRKHKLVHFLTKNFKENNDFIKKQNGAYNRIDYFLTENTAELLKNSYNLKNRYITNIQNTEIKCIVMSVENSTIGFICNSLKSLPIQLLRQYKIDKYYIDLYIPELLLAIECDEFNHKDRNIIDEKSRMKIIEKKLNCKFLRFNPNENTFDISNIISEILKIYIKNDDYNIIKRNMEELQIKHNELINNKIKSTETYLIKNEEEYNNIMNYDTNNLEELKIKCEIYKLQVEEKNIELQIKLLDFKMKLLENLENSEKIERLVDKLNTLQINNNILSNENDNNFNLNILDQYEEKQNTLPFIQCYDPNTRKLVRTFNGITEATRELKNASFSQIKHAAHHNTIYLNYRWIFIYKKEDLDKELEDIGETTPILNRVSDMIAIINLNNEIEDVLINQKAVSEKLNKSCSMINVVIKTKKIIDDKKLVYWNNVPENIKNKYLENNKLPEITEKLKGKKIIKLHPETKEIVKTYLSITDLTKEEKVSYKTIKKAIELKEQYNGFLWSY